MLPMNIFNTQTSNVWSNTSSSSSAVHAIASHDQRKETDEAGGIQVEKVKLTGLPGPHPVSSSPDQKNLTESTIALPSDHVTGTPGLKGENLVSTADESRTSYGLSSISATPENELLHQKKELEGENKALMNQILCLKTKINHYRHLSHCEEEAKLLREQQALEQKITELTEEKKELLGQIRELTSEIDYCRMILGQGLQLLHEKEISSRENNRTPPGHSN